MTFRQLITKHHPELVNPRLLGGMQGCPCFIVYGKDRRDQCPHPRFRGKDCKCGRCWDRQVPEKVANAYEKRETQHKTNYNILGQ